VNTSGDSSTKKCCAAERPASPKEAGAGVPVEFVRAPGPEADGFREIPGGEFLMGNEGDYGFSLDGEGPIHRVVIAPFLMSATCVTNEEFCAYVDATGYKTESERLGWSYVFFGHLSLAEQKQFVRLRVHGSEWWCRVDGASWRHPEGPGSTIKQRWKHPVVHISWHDALSYARWAGCRLPTEAEWEYAARGGLTQKRYPWGDDLEPEGKHRMNVWQGVFPVRNTEADGYFGTAPVKTYRANGYGLYQMTGNVWEWCWDFFVADYYAKSTSENPIGPTTGERRVMRGGSYLCHASYCNRYRVDARSSITPESATTNLGFRCVRDML
jgi:sulfatase modifying factor 1